MGIIEAVRNSRYLRLQMVQKYIESAEEALNDFNLCTDPIYGLECQKALHDIEKVSSRLRKILQRAAST
jgi:hypothetical protein